MLNPSYGFAELITARLTVDELAAALDAIGGFEERPRIAVAVSGGPDSMALMLLADPWARQRGGEARGLTVDHGLRPDSADEARIVAGWLAARGIPHDILAWGGDKPASGIQEAAREARYRLLAGWCRAHGVLHLLTAHHREDQIETHLIRRRAGSGPDGLAGMSAVRELPGCRLVRPLLGVPRARLAALLDIERQPYLLDPSNANPAFERARLRLTGVTRVSRIAGEGASGRSPEAGEGFPLTRLGPDGASHPLPHCGRGAVDAILAETRRYAQQRSAGEQTLDALIGRAVALHPAGFAAVDAAAVAGTAPEIAERLLARIAATIGGSRYPARRARVARLRTELSRAPEQARTLGGCRFVPWRGRILVLRELAAASPPLRLEPGVAVCWDRRLAVVPPAGGATALTLGYLGQSGAALPDAPGGGLPRLVGPALPALWDENGLAAVPHIGYRREGVSPLPCVLFWPVHPLGAAGFTVV